MQKQFKKTRSFIFLSNIIRKVIFIVLTLLSQNCSYSQWIQQPTPTTQHLYDIFFINSNTGWSCGLSGTLLKTTDGGINWVSINTGLTQTISSICFVNLNTGWICTRVESAIFKSTNSGLNWFKQLDTYHTLEALEFVDSLFGWAAAFGGMVYRTTNAGSTWDSTVVNLGLNDVTFLNRNTGWVCGVGRNILKTTNGGNNWVLQLGGMGGEMEAITFADINTGWAINLELWDIYKTTNSGLNWNLIYTLPDNFNSHDILFTNQNSGWACGDFGYIYSTSNGGLNWFEQNSGTGSFRKEFFFLNDTTGWSVGGGAIILHTSNGGSIVPVLNHNTVLTKEFILEQNYPNPFNPVTEIKFNLSQNSFVTLKIYNILGEEISSLINKEYRDAGRYSVKFDGSNLASGIYYYSIEAGIYKDVKKMVLIK